MFISKKAVVAATTALVLAGGGAAFAYWTSTGDGTTTGSVSEGNVGSLTLSTDSFAGLTPGATITNPVTVSNTGDAASILSISATVDPADDDCDADWFTATWNGPNAPYAISAGATAAAAGELTVTFVNSPLVNQDACKGTTLDIDLVTPAAS